MTINIVMQDETVMLEGATIVGNKRVNNGMMDVSERDLTTAMSRISMSDLEDGMTAPSVEDALQGRIAGMDIAASSGDPGDGDVDPNPWYDFHDRFFTTVDCSRRISL